MSNFFRNFDSFDLIFFANDLNIIKYEKKWKYFFAAPPAGSGRADFRQNRPENGVQDNSIQFNPIGLKF